MLIIFFWLPVLIFVLVAFIYDFLDDKKFVTRLLYKIANIGTSKDEKDNVIQDEGEASDGYIVLTEAEHSSILSELDGVIVPAIPILAPMAARVHEIRVKVDQQIKENDIIMIVEAMKMEIPVVAPENGTIGTIEVAINDLVETGALLATLLRR